MQQPDETRRLGRKNNRLAWFLLLLGFGLAVALYYAGKFVGGR